MKNRMVRYRTLGSVPGVHPCARVAVWELWLIAAGQHHDRASSHMLQARERSKFKIRSMVSTECVWLSHHHKVEKLLS